MEVVVSEFIVSLGDRPIDEPGYPTTPTPCEFRTAEERRDRRCPLIRHD